jgi:uncharacterized protein YciI
MPVVVLYEEITDGRFDLVLQTYPRHSAYVEEFAKSGDLIAIGTFDKPAENGSMGIFRTREAAERFLLADPFQLEGLIAKTRVLDWGASIHGSLSSES